jgi:hypothetical protein
MVSPGLTLAQLMSEKFFQAEDQDVPLPEADTALSMYKLVSCLLPFRGVGCREGQIVSGKSSSVQFSLSECRSRCPSQHSRHKSIKHVTGKQWPSKVNEVFTLPRSAMIKRRLSAFTRLTIVILRVHVTLVQNDPQTARTGSGRPRLSI